MLRYFILFIFIYLAMLDTGTAKDKRNIRKKRHSGSRVTRLPRVTKHSRKSRHYRHGNGPNLKTITTDSPYKEYPNNGVNPIETKQPEQ